MMHTWFECKIRYEKVMENGMNKKVTEPYLVDGSLFRTSNAPTTANCSPLKKMQPTAGLSASCSSLRWTKKAEQRKRPPLPYWYKLPTFATL